MLWILINRVLVMFIYITTTPKHHITHDCGQTDTPVEEEQSSDVSVLTCWFQGLSLKMYTSNLQFLSHSRGSWSATHVTAVSARLQTMWQLYPLWGRTEKPVLLTWYLCSALVHAVVSVTQMNVVDFQRWRSQPFHCYRTGFQLLQRQFVVVCVSKLL